MSIATLSGAEFGTPEYERLFRFEHFREKSGIPKRYFGGFEAYNPDLANECEVLKRDAEAWAEGFRPGETERGLYLSGNTGCGKTHLACAIGLRVIMDKQDDVVRFVNASNMLAEIRSTFRNNTPENNAELDFIDLYSTIPLWILDDFGAERVTGFALETIYMILNRRYENELPVIVTSNYGGKQLVERLGGDHHGERILSRLIGMADGGGLFPQIDFRMKGRK